MPLCPRCAKKFKDNSSVLKHMNQLISSCHIYYEEVLQVNNALLNNSLLHSVNNNLPHPTSSHAWAPHNFDNPPDMDHVSYMDVDVVNPTSHDHSPPQPSPPTFPFFKETHPTASTVYGKGSTFMDIFDKDSHASKRMKQLYYPFASKDEWELASFLLRSNLSMASIDKFLKLNLVGASPVSFYF